ncbi:hypothetical protein [Acetobacter pasteurianus]|uniref:hypothetical protein n=1 Tax=Acetobacter TaxID=434 RepID=UPI000676C884|nr:hypothetical protein [Acetobacter pasteurianus]AKR49440.1 hypothetical protein DB34_11440 [Acetobacter pasteurianus]
MFSESEITKMIAEIKRKTAQNTVSPKAARASLIRSGFLSSNGEVSPQFDTARNRTYRRETVRSARTLKTGAERIRPVQRMLRNNTRAS